MPRSVLSIAAALLVFSPAVAQELGGALDLGQLGADIGVNNAIRTNVARAKPTGNAARARTSTAAAFFDFTPSLERRRHNLAQFVAKSRARDPQSAARLEKLFSTRDVIGQINGQLGAYGLRANHVADAYTAWWINAWLASRGRTDDATPRQIEAVRAQAAQALSTLPQMAGASDAVKQQTTEAYLVQTALIGASLEQARGDPGRLSRLGAAVRQGARASGLDLDTMELTDAGFVAASKGAQAKGATR